MDNKRGVLIYAYGYSYYGMMAANLAVSIKAVSPNMRIALMLEPGMLDVMTPEQQRMFDQLIPLDPQWINGRHGRDPFYPKLWMDQVTPFDQTLFLDADQLWCPYKTVEDLFKECEMRQFQSVARQRVTIGDDKLKSEWVDLPQVKQLFGFDQLYDISSEVIYFETTGADVFEEARAVYREDSELNVMDFGGGKPDEPYLMLAIEATGTQMVCPWMPSYWQPYYFTKVHPQEFIMNHYTVSVGGAHTQRPTLKIYNNLLRMYYQRMGFLHPFYLQPKSRFIPTRKKI